MSKFTTKQNGWPAPVIALPLITKAPAGEGRAGGKAGGAHAGGAMQAAGSRRPGQAASLLPATRLWLIQPGQECVVGGEMLVIVNPAAPVSPGGGRWGPWLGAAWPAVGAGLAIAGDGARRVRCHQAGEAGPPGSFEPAVAAHGRPVVHAPQHVDDHYQGEHDPVASHPHHGAARVQVSHRARRPGGPAGGGDSRGARVAVAEYQPGERVDG